jgi:hypothetical protein
MYEAFHVFRDKRKKIQAIFVNFHLPLTPKKFKLGPFPAKAILAAVFVCG